VQQVLQSKTFTAAAATLEAAAATAAGCIMRQALANFRYPECFVLLLLLLLLL
jgi:hypothetical protein